MEAGCFKQISSRIMDGPLDAHTDAIKEDVQIWPK